MEQKICQSCGMPMTTAEEFGTNQDGTLNQDYCIYCIKEGNFTEQITMDEMITQCAEYPDSLKDEKGNSMSKEEFIAKMQAYFPTLKRWQQQ